MPRQEHGKRGERRGSEFRELFTLMWLFWMAVVDGYISFALAMIYIYIYIYYSIYSLSNLSIGGYFQDVLRYNTYQYGILWAFCTMRPRDARYPVLPYWLDGTELNGWDQQSQYFGRFGGWLV